MLRLCSMLFAAVLIVVAWFIVATTGQLADPVATHFGSDYLANGFMTRDGYLAFSLAFSTLLPVIVAGAVGWLPRLFPRSVNVPNRDYWLAPERRAATLDEHRDTRDPARRPARHLHGRRPLADPAGEPSRSAAASRPSLLGDADRVPRCLHRVDRRLLVEVSQRRRMIGDT